jgi:hypothetical protein
MVIKVDGKKAIITRLETPQQQIEKLQWAAYKERVGMSIISTDTGLAGVWVLARVAENGRAA